MKKAKGEAVIVQKARVQTARVSRHEGQAELTLQFVFLCL